MPGKGRATSYGDFYKNRENVPDDNEEDLTRSTKPDTPATSMVARRKAALKKRLLARKVGK